MTDTEFQQATELGSSIIRQVEGWLAAIKSKKSAEDKRLLASGKIFELNSMFSLAIDTYRKVLAVTPNEYEAQARLAITMLRCGQRADGLNIALELNRQNPKFTFRSLGDKQTSSRTVLGDALLLNGKIEEARQVYQEALALVRDDPYATSQLILILIQSDELDEARTLAKGAKLAPGSESLQAVLTLSGNDPSVLPALLGVKINAMAHVEGNAA